MIKVYHVPFTRSVRPIWMCHELGLPVEVVELEWSEEYRQSKAWREISPPGKVPAMVDRDLTMFESGAMISYLIEKYGRDKWLPTPGSHESALHHQWCWFSEATLPKPLGLSQVLRAKDNIQELPALAKARVHEGLGVVEDALQDRDYLLGNEFAACDVMMGYTVVLMQFLLGTSPPRITHYIERLKERPGFQAAVGELPK